MESNGSGSLSLTTSSSGITPVPAMPGAHGDDRLVPSNPNGGAQDIDVSSDQSDHRIVPRPTRASHVDTRASPSGVRRVATKAANERQTSRTRRPTSRGGSVTPGGKATSTERLKTENDILRFELDEANRLRRTSELQAQHIFHRAQEETTSG